MSMIARAACLAALLQAAPALAGVDVAIVWLKVGVDRPPVLSNLDPVPADEGLQGARLGLADNRTTGGFLGHDYQLAELAVQPGGDAVLAARAALLGARILVLDAPAEAVLAIADLPEAQGALILSTTAPDRRLRDADCRANLLHTGVTYEMRADALMQVMVQKRWTDLAMITGPNPADLALAAALRASATKFGLSIVADKPWPIAADLRRSAAAEVPLFTQDLADHDALLIADETDDFARYIAYNAWLPRPVVGSEGLVPAGWSPVVEAAGAVQLQNRFEEQSGRSMRPADYAAWAALRTVGEAVTRTGSADPAALRAYILSDAFELAGFKGRPLSYRPWNGQLRQPVPVSHPRALVAMAPVEGFLHQVNELDTLGLDRAESACKAFGG